VSAKALKQALIDAGLIVKQSNGWETRGGGWWRDVPSGIMQHHTAPPVPFPIERLDGSGDGRIKCNINTKPDGSVWLIAYRACNYSSGPGSSVVLNETLRNATPTNSAKARGLKDDTNGNPIYWNFENDHAGDGSTLPRAQSDALITATRITLDHFGLQPNQVIAHAEWTARKIDPRWNGQNAHQALTDIRSTLGDTMEKVPVQTWAISAYEWATTTKPTAVYNLTDKVPDIAAIRETADDQREMVFLWRAATNFEGASGVPREEYEAHRHGEGTTGPPK
jgi:hypothetical protein